MSQLFPNRKRKISQSCSSPTTNNTTHNLEDVPTITTAPTSSSTVDILTSDFMEYFPIEIRLEIYSFVNHVREAYVWFPYENQQYDYRLHGFIEEIHKAYDLLEPQIIIAAIMNDMEALHMLLPQITKPYFQYEAAQILARHGRLKALQWYCQFCNEYGIRMMEDLYEYDDFGGHQNIGLRGHLCKCAAFYGHRHIIQWIMQHDSTVVSAGCCQQAASGGHLKLLVWLHEQGCEWDEKTCSSAAWKGHLEVLKYAHENGCPWNAATCTEAASHGHLEILMYAHDHGCPWDEHTCKFAAENGHLEILKYLHENGCPWNEDSCWRAAQYGHLEILKYLHVNGCSWDRKTCMYAAFKGHLEVLKYAHENGCPWDDNTFHCSRHFEIRTYVREHGCPRTEEIASEENNSEEEQDDEIESDENGE